APSQSADAGQGPRRHPRHLARHAARGRRAVGLESADLGRQGQARRRGGRGRSERGSDLRDVARLPDATLSRAAAGGRVSARYYTLIASLPALEYFETAKRTPINRVRLEQRLTMLEPDDAVELRRCEQLLAWRVHGLRDDAATFAALY